jgi:hypothetical protein
MKFLYFAAIILATNMANTAFSEEKQALEPAEAQNQIAEEQYKEALLECRLEVLEEAQSQQDKEINALEIDNSLFEQEGNNLRSCEKGECEERAARKRRAERWERDHSRE